MPVKGSVLVLFYFSIASTWLDLVYDDCLLHLHPHLIVQIEEGCGCKDNETLQILSGCIIRSLLREMLIPTWGFGLVTGPRLSPSSADLLLFPKLPVL